MPFGKKEVRWPNIRGDLMLSVLPSVLLLGWHSMVTFSSETVHDIISPRLNIDSVNCALSQLIIIHCHVFSIFHFHFNTILYLQNVDVW
jgi:hypothetical protein